MAMDNTSITVLQAEIKQLKNSLATLEKKMTQKDKLLQKNKAFQVSKDMWIKEKIELQKSERKYRSRIMNLIEGFYSASIDGKLLDYNSEFCRILGLDNNKDYVGFILPDIWQDPEDRKLYLEALKQNGTIQNYIINAKKSNGENIVLQINSRLIKDEEGKPGRIEGTFLDITEHKLVEEESRNRQDTISAIIETSRDWIWSIDSDGKHTYCNPALLNILGYPPDEIIGKSSLILLHEEDRKFVEANLPEWIAQKKGWKNLILRWRHKDGSWRWLESNAVPILHADGELTGFRGVDRDITERRQTEEALHNLAVSFAAVSGEEFFNKVSEYLTDKLNFDYAFIGKLVDGHKVEMIGGSGKGAVLEPFEYDLKNTPCANAMEKSLCCYKSGIQKLFPNDLLLVEMNIDGYLGSYLFDNSGKPVGIIVLLNERPITNQKIAESTLQIFSDRVSAEIQRIQAVEALEESERQYRLLFDNAPDAYYIIDLKGNFVDGNIASEKLIGMDKSELIGKNILTINFLLKNQLPRAAKLLVRNIRGKSTGPDEFTIKRKDGSQIEVEISTHPVKFKDKIHVLSIARDITERKKVAEELRDSERMNKALLNTTSDSVLLIDKNGNINTINSAMAKGFGKTSNKLINKNVYDILPPNLGKQRKKKGEEAAKSGKVVRFIDRRAGRWLDNSIYPIYDEKRKHIQFAIFSQDITERKLAEDELEKHRIHLEELVSKRTKELEASNLDLLDRSEKLEAFNKMMLDRELRIIEMKEEVNALCKELGREIKYQPLWRDRNKLVV